MSRAVVIGSGFGGLASCVHLLKKGYKVTLLEARDELGGRAGVTRKDGYTFDKGPTVITAPYLLNELFLSLDEDPRDYYELMALDVFYRVIFADNSSFDYCASEEQLIENIRNLCPADVDGYLKLAEHARDIFDVGYTQLADKPFDTVSSMLRVIPDMIRLKNYRSVYSLVSHYIKDDRLRRAFSFEPLLVGGNPTKITSIYLLIHWLERKWGVHFAKGGTTSLIHAFAKLLEKKGADIQCNAKVSEVLVEKGRVSGVRLSSGREIPCDLVVSNADPVRLYRDCIDPKHRSKHSNRSLNAKKQSMSLFVCYFGTRKTYPELEHHTILLGDRYEGLLKDIFDRKVLADDFSLYLHAPTRTDASMAPKGCESFYVLSPVPNNDCGVNWNEKAAAYKEKIYSELQRRLLPQLKESMEVDFHVDPIFFEQDLNSEKGAAFGIEPSFQQSAYFRFHNKSEDIENLFFVGANTHPGAGVPGVLNSAKVLNRLIPDISKEFNSFRRPRFEELSP